MSSQRLRNTLVPITKSRRAARMVLPAITVLAVIALTPHIRSAGAATAPTFTQTNLISDVPGMASRTDAALVNPWGMAVGLNGGLWVCDNGSGKSTVYDGTGAAVPPQSITKPAPGSGGGTSAPTGVATNATTGFVISAGGKSGPSSQLFATEDGTIAGWNSSVDATKAIIAVDNSAMGAVFKGLAIGFNDSGAYLFATNFATGTIDVFDSGFKPVNKTGMFRDQFLPRGYAPFGIASINARLYVTYALQDSDKKDDVAGSGSRIHRYIRNRWHVCQTFRKPGCAQFTVGHGVGSVRGFRSVR